MTQRYTYTRERTATTTYRDPPPRSRAHSPRPSYHYDRSPPRDRYYDSGSDRQALPSPSRIASGVRYVTPLSRNYSPPRRHRQASPLRLEYAGSSRRPPSLSLDYVGPSRRPPSLSLDYAGPSARTHSHSRSHSHSHSRSPGLRSNEELCLSRRPGGGEISILKRDKKEKKVMGMTRVERAEMQTDLARVNEREVKKKNAKAARFDDGIAFMRGASGNW